MFLKFPTVIHQIYLVGSKYIDHKWFRNQPNKFGGYILLIKTLETKH